MFLKIFQQFKYFLMALQNSTPELIATARVNLRFLTSLVCLNLVLKAINARKLLGPTYIELSETKDSV